MRGTRRSRQSTVDSRREKTEQSSKPNRAHEMDAPSQNGNCWYTPWQFLRERQTNNLQDTSLGIIHGRRTDNDLDGVKRSCQLSRNVGTTSIKSTLEDSG